MRTCHKIILLITFASAGTTAIAQTAKTLTNDGIALFDKGDYAGAIEKYKQALKTDTGNLQADFELAYTLETTGKGLEGIPYLEKILRSNDSKYETYELLGTIYDDNNQPEKAVEAYKAGITEKSDFARLHLNLAITYTGLKKYTEAESEALEAIKLDPKHASNQRVYATATYLDQKRDVSLLAWCSFLLLEPQSERSPRAVAYIKDILGYGIKNGDKKVNINISNSDLGTNQLGMSMAVVAATSNKKGLSAVDSLTLQLTSVFQILGEQSVNKNNAFTNYYAKYFANLSVTDNMPAFVRYISISAYTDENTAWFKEHDKELKAFQKWLSDTKRDF